MPLKPARLQWSDDGVLLNLDYGDIYFQRGQGIDESRFVFIERNQLPQRFAAMQHDSFHIAELGFGSGLNFLLTAQTFDRHAAPGKRLHYVSIEKHPIDKTNLEKIYTHWPELTPYSKDLLAQYPPLIEGFHRITTGRITLTLAFGDVADVLPELSGVYDAWFLDGFAPAKNPDMWQESLFRLIADKTTQRGTLATFSAAGHVRRGLETAGFSVTKTKGYGVKRDMTVAEIRDGRPRNPTPDKNITIIGAGIAGCSAAHAFAQRGYKVSIVDRHQTPAAETSGNPIGIIYPKLTVDPAPLGEYHSHAFSFTRNILTRLNISSWNPCGVLHIDLDAEDAQRSDALVRRREYPENYLVRKENGLYLPMAGYLSPPEFCKALIDHPLISFTPAQDMPTIDPAQLTLIATGTGSRHFPQTKWLPLQILRGQVSFAHPGAATENIDLVLCHEGYITPAVNGLHYIGATFEKSEVKDFDVRETDHAANLHKLERYIPGLGLTINHVTGGKTGYRAATPDKIPMAGFAPDAESFLGQTPSFHLRILLSTGFGAHGMSGAPFVGDVIASLVNDEPLPLPLWLMEHLKPERFILRDLKRRKI